MLWAVVCTGGCLPVLAQTPQVSLFLDPGSTYLDPTMSTHVVRVLLQNSGGPFPVVGGTFYFQIDNGLGTVPGPSITGANLIGIPGNPFTSLNVVQSSTSTSGPFWEVSFSTLPDPANPSDPLAPVNLTPNTTYTFAEVTVDTTGFTTVGQTWSLNLTGTLSGNPYFDIEDSNPPYVVDYFPSASNGTLQIGVAPIPEAATSSAGLGLTGLALLSWCSRRRSGMSTRP